MDPSPFDPARLSLAANKTKLPARKHRRKPLRPRKGEWFIKGPIPGSWIGRAAGLNQRALRAALAIWCEAGIAGSRTVRMSARTLRRFKIPKDGCRKGLQDLRAAGLVSIVQKPGRRPEITIEDIVD